MFCDPPRAIIVRAARRRLVIVNGPPDRCLFRGPCIVEDELWFGSVQIGWRVRHIETGIAFRANLDWVTEAPPLENVVDFTAARHMRQQAGRTA
jgi:hypothetical protein